MITGPLCIAVSTGPVSRPAGSCGKALRGPQPCVYPAHFRVPTTRVASGSAYCQQIFGRNGFIACASPFLFFAGRSVLASSGCFTNCYKPVGLKQNNRSLLSRSSGGWKWDIQWDYTPSWGFREASVCTFLLGGGGGPGVFALQSLLPHYLLSSLSPPCDSYKDTCH